MNIGTLSMKVNGFSSCTKILTKGVVAGAICGMFMIVGVQQADASYMLEAASVTTTTGENSPPYDIGNIIDQSGLTSSYSSGHTDFDTFTSTVKHSWVPENNEWWAPYGITGGSVAFDLGGVFSVDGLAFWNEDWGGIATINVWASQGNSNTFTNVGTFSLSDNAFGQNYSADVFKFSAINTQLIRFDLTAQTANLIHGLPPTNSIGEVAFSTPNPVPEPATMLLFGLGATGLFGMKRKKR